VANLKPGDFVPRWPRERAVRRLLMCAGMLNVHGFMTTRERRRVQARVVKWVDEQAKRGAVKTWRK